MSSLDITQAEADALLAMEKCRINNQSWDYPSLGEILTYSLFPVINVRISFLILAGVGGFL